MKYPDYLDLAEFHARRYLADHGQLPGPLLCVCAGESGLFTRSAFAGADPLDRAALRRELRTQYADAGFTQAFYLSVGDGAADGIPFGPALFLVTYEKGQPDRGRVLFPQPEPRFGGATRMATPAGQVTSPFPELLTRP